MIEFNSSFFLQLINFLVLILILHLFLFKPILKNLNKRNDLIRSLKEDTESLNKKADRLVEEYNISIANTKKESMDIINKAKAEAVTEQNRIISIDSFFALAMLVLYSSTSLSAFLLRLSLSSFRERIRSFLLLRFLSIGLNRRRWSISIKTRKFISCRKKLELNSII